MGFSDLGVTGSKIRTPNIDRLAKDGALLTMMYNCARCCPTRASGYRTLVAGKWHVAGDFMAPEGRGTGNHGGMGLNGQW